MAAVADIQTPGLTSPHSFRAFFSFSGDSIDIILFVDKDGMLHLPGCEIDSNHQDTPKVQAVTAVRKMTGKSATTWLTQQKEFPRTDVIADSQHVISCIEMQQVDLERLREMLKRGIPLTPVAGVMHLSDVVIRQIERPSGVNAKHLSILHQLNAQLTHVRELRKKEAEEKAKAASA